MSMMHNIERDFGAEQIAPGVAVRESDVGANVTALASLKRGCAAGLGDGRVVMVGAGGLSEHLSHEGAVTAVAATSDGGVISAGQDGRVMKLLASGESEQLLDAKGEWITAAAHHEQSGLTAAAFGRTVVLAGADGMVGRFSDHPSAVSDLVFSPNGDRVAVCRYDGVTLWNTKDPAEPTKLYWKGSAVAVSWSPQLTITHHRDKTAAQRLLLFLIL